MKDTDKAIAYLERIGFCHEGVWRADGESLRKIQYAHVTSVPYENIDILNGVPVDLSVEAVFDKVVRRGRGGYCFELNGLYAWLLRALGFGVTEFLARFLKDAEGIPMRRHRVLKVEAEDGVYLCDVGTGIRAPRFPVRLEEGIVQEQFGESYRLELRDFYGWVLMDKSGEQWRDVFSFTEEVQVPVDFVMPSFFCEKHEDSIFNKDYMVSIKTHEGRKTLDGNVFKVFEGAHLARLETLDEASIALYLKEHFGLDVAAQNRPAAVSGGVAGI